MLRRRGASALARGPPRPPTVLHRSVCLSLSRLVAVLCVCLAPTCRQRAARATRAPAHQRKRTRPNLAACGAALASEQHKCTAVLPYLVGLTRSPERNASRPAPPGALTLSCVLHRKSVLCGTSLSMGATGDWQPKTVVSGPDSGIRHHVGPGLRRWVPAAAAPHTRSHPERSAERMHGLIVAQAARL